MPPPSIQKGLCGLQRGWGFYNRHNLYQFGKLIHNPQDDIIFYDFGKIVIESMDISCHGSGEMDNNLHLIRDSVCLALYPSLYKVGYILIHAWPILLLWHHLMVILFTSMFRIGTIIFSINANSLNYFCGTSPQLCLYASNLSTNLTSFNCLALAKLTLKHLSFEVVHVPLQNFALQISFFVKH